jgi:hypothetical protein
MPEKHEDDRAEREWEKAVAEGLRDDLADEREDIYTEQDGKAIPVVDGPGGKQPSGCLPSPASNGWRLFKHGTSTGL